MAYGMRVSKTGEDVNTAGTEELIFRDDADPWKIVAEGSAAGNAVITHNLGYCPAFDIFKISSGLSRKSCLAYSTSTQLILKLDAGDTVKYKIYSTKLA